MASQSFLILHSTYISKDIPPFGHPRFHFKIIKRRLNVKNKVADKQHLHRTFKKSVEQNTFLLKVVSGWIWGKSRKEFLSKINYNMKYHYKSHRFSLKKHGNNAPQVGFG